MKLTANPVGWRCGWDESLHAILTDKKEVADALQEAGWVICPLYADLDNDQAGMELEQVLEISTAFGKLNDNMQTNAEEFLAEEIFAAIAAFQDNPATPADYEISALSDEIAKHLLRKFKGK